MVSYSFATHTFMSSVVILDPCYVSIVMMKEWILDVSVYRIILEAVDEDFNQIIEDWKTWVRN